MIINKVILPERPQSVEYRISDDQMALLMPVGDVHFGAKECDLGHFKRHLEWGMERGAWFFGMGDMLDFTAESQQKVFMNLRKDTRMQLESSVLDKVEEFKEIIHPTKGAWIGMIHGNHNWEFDDGTNIEQRLCQEVGGDYFGDMAMIRIVLGQAIKYHPEADTIIVAHHGVGTSATTAGGQLLKPEQLMKWLAADIILMGHSHGKIAAPIDRLHLTPDGILSHRTTIIARTGGFLQGYKAQTPFTLDTPAWESEGSYVERKAYSPTALGGICISLGIDKVKDSVYYRPVIHFSE